MLSQGIKVLKHRPLNQLPTQGNLYTGEGDLPLVQLSIHLKMAVCAEKIFCFIFETTKPTVG
jgi:hypothetical protein